MLLRIVNNELPQKQQEGLETIIGLIAVAAVTYMIVWMRRNARGLRRTLEQGASSALVEGTALALIGMAFLAVLREGFETAVFLLAVFQDSTDAVAAGYRRDARTGWRRSRSAWRSIAAASSST